MCSVDILDRTVPSIIYENEINLGKFGAREMGVQKL